jgi:hypothetical protein
MSMPKKRIRSRISRKSQDNAPGKVRLYLMMGLTAAIILTGFFFAARQHFTSIDYSIRNSSLRRQLEELESEKRRLLLAKERSTSPYEIKKAVQKLGIGVSTEMAPQLASAVTSGPSGGGSKPLVQKTAAVDARKPAAVSASFSVNSSPLTSEKAQAKTQPAKDKKVKS